jgi:peptide alpha-N-acetyltransferase
MNTPSESTADSSIEFITYSNESQLPSIQRLMEADLSEPYSIYTYRYFINNWPKLCWMVLRFARLNLIFISHL